MIMNEGIHFEMLKQLIDPPKSSEHQEVGNNCNCNYDIIDQEKHLYPQKIVISFI